MGALGWLVKSGGFQSAWDAGTLEFREREAGHSAALGCLARIENPRPLALQAQGTLGVVVQQTGIGPVNRPRLAHKEEEREASAVKSARNAGTWSPMNGRSTSQLLWTAWARVEDMRPLALQAQGMPGFVVQQTLNYP